MMLHAFTCIETTLVKVKLRQLKKKTLRCKAARLKWKSTRLLTEYHAYLKYPSLSSSPHQLKTKLKESTGG